MRKHIIIVYYLLLCSFCLAGYRGRVDLSRNGRISLTVAASDTPNKLRSEADYQCDGTADEAQIQTALDALPSGGGKVSLLEGTYNVRAVILPPDDIVLEGAGYATRILKPVAVETTLTASASSSDTVLAVTSSTGFVAGDTILLFADDKVNWDSDYHTIVSIVSNNITVTPAVNDSFTTGQSAGISNEFPIIRLGKALPNNTDSANVTIRNMRLDGNTANRATDDETWFRNALVATEADGVHTTPTNFLFEGLHLVNSSSDGIGIQRADGAIVNNCYITAADEKGVHLGSSSEWVSVTNCTDYGSDYSFYFCNGTQYCSFVNCRSDDATQFGVYVDDGTSENNNHFVIANNVIYSPGTTGIFLDSKYGSVTGNVIYNSGSIGINFSEGAIHHCLTGNTIIESTARSLNINGAYNLITGNYIYDSVVTAGSPPIEIFAAGDYNTITGNTIFSADDAGDNEWMFEIGAGAVGNTVTGNTIYVTDTDDDPFLISDYANIIMNNVTNHEYIEQKFIYRRNTSGSTLLVGDVVIDAATAESYDGTQCTITTTAGDSRVLGMALESIADDAIGMILVAGQTGDALNVDGTDDIAIGDYLSAFTTQDIAQKTASGEVAFAVALEGYTTNDSAGVIDAILIIPRQTE